MPQSLNRYSYVQNDPVNSVDPDGRNMCPAQFGSCGGGGDSGSGFRGNWADDGGFFGGGGGMSAAEAAYVARLQITYDGIDARNAWNNGNYSLASDILNRNPNVGLSVNGLTLWGALGAQFATGYGQELSNIQLASSDPTGIGGRLVEAGLMKAATYLRSLRGPDFFVANISAGIQGSYAVPRGGTFKDAVISVGISGLEGSIFAGWLWQVERPSTGAVTSFLSGLSGSFDIFLNPKTGIGAGVGIGAMGSPLNDGTRSAILIGGGIGGGGALGWGYNYNDLRRIFGGR